MMNSGLVPGAASINVLMRRHMNIDLTDPQANALWEECRGKLVEAGMHRTIAAAQASYYGCLNKAVQADLSHMLWKCFMASPYPRTSNGADMEQATKLNSVLSQRGYKKSPHQIIPLQLAS